jgi:hypothetical protein
MDQEFNLDKNEITIGKEKNEKKDILDENTIKEEISTISENIDKIDLRNSNNSKIGKNNNSTINGKKENNLSNQIIFIEKI